MHPHRGSSTRPVACWCGSDELAVCSRDLNGDLGELGGEWIGAIPSSVSRGDRQYDNSVPLLSLFPAEQCPLLFENFLVDGCVGWGAVLVSQLIQSHTTLLSSNPTKHAFGGPIFEVQCMFVLSQHQVQLASTKMNLSLSRNSI